MSLVNLPTLLLYPGMLRGGFAAQSPSSANETNLLLDAANEAIAQCFPAPKAGDIEKIKFLTATVVSGGTMNISIEPADQKITSGGGSACAGPAWTQALWATGTTVAKTILSTDDSVWLEATLGTNATVTEDQLFAVVFRNDASSPCNMNFQHRRHSGPAIYPSGNWRNAMVVAQGAPPTAFSNGLRPHYLMCAIKYVGDSTWYTPTSLPMGNSYGVQAFNNGSSTTRRGLRFQLPFPARLALVIPVMQTGNDGSDYQFKVYDDSGTELATSTTLDAAQHASTENRAYDTFAYLDPPVELDANTWYRVAAVPTSATNIGLWEFTVADADMLQAMVGANWYSTAFTSGSWTNDTGKYPYIILGLDQIDDGAGGGGGLLVHTGMVGGMRG